jgi:hypothetical protein
MKEQHGRQVIDYGIIHRRSKAASALLLIAAAACTVAPFLTREAAAILGAPRASIAIGFVILASSLGVWYVRAPRQPQRGRPVFAVAVVLALLGAFYALAVVLLPLVLRVADRGVALDPSARVCVDALAEGGVTSQAPGVRVLNAEHHNWPEHADLIKIQLPPAATAGFIEDVVQKHTNDPHVKIFRYSGHITFPYPDNDPSWWQPANQSDAAVSIVFDGGVSGEWIAFSRTTGLVHFYKWR